MEPRFRRPESGIVTAEVHVRPCPGGPVLVRGADTVVAEDGTSHEVTRPVVAVCVCGKSSLTPWCDGTHKAAPTASPQAPR
jgi:CDGSH-type Zn-finger protein